MDRLVLSIGRIAYAILAGASLLVVSLNPSLTDTVGQYTLQAGLAASAAAVLPIGLDRAIARRRAAGEISGDIPLTLVKTRAVEIALIIAFCAISAPFSWAPIAIACGAFAASRLLYADLETFWIASGRSMTMLGIVVIANGLITAAGTVLGAPYGASVMVLTSSAGNFVAFASLLLLGRWQRSSTELQGIEKEAGGFGLSALLAVVYSRVDLLILAVLDVNLTAVAVYGIVTRGFDAAGLIRGSVAQLESRALARETEAERYRRVIALTKRTAVVSACIAAVTTAALTVLLPLPVFDAWNSEKAILFIAALSIPAYMMHLSTTALVFADRRSHILLIGSVIAAAGATSFKLGFIGISGVGGAVAAIGACEVLSFVIFIWAYRSSVPIRDVTVVTLVAIATALIPTIALVLT